MTPLPTSLETRIKVLKETIAWFKKHIEPHDCGWMYTTIDGLKYRIKELRKEHKNFSKIKQEPWITGYNKWKNERCPHN